MTESKSGRSSELEDRRQRAREAAWDNARLDDHTEIPDVEAAIKAAARVQITHGVTKRAVETMLARRPDATPSRRRALRQHLIEYIKAAFEDAGFEVIE